jgi:trimethylamine:corrinoid methyltransferase-like protein
VRDQHLLTAEHTLEHWPEELYLPGPTLDRTNWDQWAEQGSRDWRARSNAVIDELLANHEVEPLEERVRQEIQQLISSTCREQPGVELPSPMEEVHG